MADRSRLSAFTSRPGEQKFLSVYEDAMARLFPSDMERADVPTSFGTVRTYCVGPVGGGPVVLLAGAGGSAVSWYSYVRPLSTSHRVVLVDPIGEPGRSHQTRAVNDGADAGRWLAELLTEADLTDAHLVGASYGGWTALNAAICAPERVARLTLVDAAGILPLDRRFYKWVILSGLAGLLPATMRRRAARRLANGTLLDADLMRLVGVSTRFRRRLPPANPLTDDELRKITAPVHGLFGERSTLHNADAVAQRLSTVMSSATAEVVPGTGHALQIERPDVVLKAISQPAAQVMPGDLSGPS